jgi:hypothetical protein
VNDDNLMKWQSLVDQQIRQAQEDGRLGSDAAGRPLRLDDNPYTPPDQRMAHKVLKDNNFVPEWIAQRQQIEAQQADLLRQVEKAVRAYRDTVAAAIVDPASGETRRLQARSAFAAARQRLDEAAARLNREIVSYNLKVPPGVDQRPLVDVARMIERLLRA